MRKTEVHMVARTPADLQQEYRPYDTLPAFHQGFAVYGQQYQIRNPYEGQPHNSADAKARDQGLNVPSDGQGNTDDLRYARVSTETGENPRRTVA
jgi:hypothetical protein